ncbi:MAG: hypothetical protein ACP5KW_09650 [Thermoproteota archaeon]
MEEEKEIVIEIGPREIIVLLAFVVLLILSVPFALDFFKPKLNLRVEVKKFGDDAFLVNITGKITEGFNVISKDVGIEVRDPDNNLVWIDIANSGNSGFCSAFLIKDAKKGDYVVYATTDIISEKTKFKLVNP